MRLLTTGTVVLLLAVGVRSHSDNHTTLDGQPNDQSNQLSNQPVTSQQSHLNQYVDVASTANTSGEASIYELGLTEGVVEASSSATVVDAAKNLDTLARRGRCRRHRLRRCRC